MSRLRRSPSLRLLVMRGMIAAVSAVGLVASPALATVYDTIEIVVKPQPAVEGGPAEMRSGGYTEYRLEIRNRSKTVDHEVRLIHPARPAPSYTDYLERESRTVQVPHGSTVAVSLFQPSLAVTDESLAVEIDGFRQKDFVEMPYPFGTGFGYSYIAPGTRAALVVLASRGVPQELKDKVRDAHPNEIAFCRSELPVGDWSANWLGYTGYDALLLAEDDAADLPAEVLLAIRRYAEIGGIVLVLGSSTDPKQIVPEALRDPDVAADAEGAFPVGFGLVRPCPETVPWPGEFWIAKSKPAVAPLDRDVRIASDVTAPVRGILILVICFAIGIGPVNVWLLSRRQKRMWLWWNVPAVSLATCLTVFGYSLVSEGISGHGRTALITLLDENTHRATTLGYASYYCPLTPSDGVHFSYETEVSQLYSTSGGPRRMRVGRAKSLDWTHDQHLDFGWVLARVPACFAIRKSETRRERMSIHREPDGTLTALNGLGVDIDSLYYVDENGAVGVASDLPAGQKRILDVGRSTGRSPTAASESLRDVFDQSWDVSLRDLRSFPEKFVAPGCYVAVVKKSPFLEDPLVAAPQSGSIGVIYGIGARSGNGR